MLKKERNRMNPRGHRGFAAVLMLLALVLSAMALVPAIAQAQSNQITGLVSDCQTGLPVNAAVVTLVDANGVNAPLTFTTSGSGTYAFTPPASNYTISVSAPGHYAGGIATPFRFDGTITIANKNVCLYAQPTTTKALKVSVTSSAGVVGGAQVQVYNNSNPTLKTQFVTNGTTNTTTGNVTMTLWTPGLFEVRVYATGYQPYINAAVDMSVTTTLSVVLTAGVRLAGWARDASGRYITSGVTGVLYNPTAATSSGTKLITATVTGSFYSFNAPTGTYRMVIAANGYLAGEATVTLSGSPTTVFQNVTLPTAPRETYLTTALFGPKDWNNLTLYRNLTLDADSTLPGLNPANLRDLRMQINYTLGNGQTTGTGTVSTGDANAFRQWLLNNGPIYTTTDTFLLLNLKSYNSSVTSYSATVSNTLLTPGLKVWINTTATYQVKSKAWINYGAPKYYLNATLFPDTNTTVYRNQTYIVQLPRGYEMTSDTILPSTTPPAITTSGYTRITMDPGLVSGTPQIRMVLEPATVGVARAKVIGPTGKYDVVNAAYQSYQAFVANNTDIQFSAAESSNPPSNDSSRENFTWRFLANMTGLSNPANNVRWGIQPTFRFLQAGAYVANLTAVGSGGNVSYRNLTLWVDGVPPRADFRTNLTGSGSAIGLTLKINQGTMVKFDGSLSTDLAYPGKNGVIPNSGYAWDFNGDRITDATGRNVTWTFSKAGLFKVNLSVTDGVGLKGANATMNVQVNDTRAPKPDFSILDPANEYAPITSLMEGRNYTFNASKTTDDYDKLSALNFTWTIPGPVYGMQGINNTLWGVNITFAWSTFNLSYALKLTVKDTGFGSGRPNWGNLTRNLSVQIDWTKHADLYIAVGSMKIDNTNPQEGQTITITLNVTNKPNRATARQIQVGVAEISGIQRTALAPTWTLVDSHGNPLSSPTIAAGATVTVQIRVTVVGQGNKTIQVVVADATEPWTVRTSENFAQLTIAVSQAAWVTPAIIGAVVAVFAVFIFAMYYRRKVKAGEWQPRFRREKGEGEKERPKKEKEVKEEKKRL